MYMRTPQSAVWAGTPNDPVRHQRPPRVMRWATRPLHTEDGVARALRFDGDRASVLLDRNGARRWAPLGAILSDERAERWIRTGFRPGG